MALGSWQGLYNSVVLDLMAQQRERELLLLMAITSHADAFGFCFPGRARLKGLRHCAKTTELRDEIWLMQNKYITVEDVVDAMLQVERPFYQVSPRVMYVREDLQEYCEAVFDGFRDRDLAWEKKLRLILSSTKDSQPESLTRRKSKNQNQSQDQTQNQTQNQRRRIEQKERTSSTMRNAQTDQSEAQTEQRRKAQHRKTNPQAGPDEFEALLSPTVDDDRMVQEIRHVASTTEYQALDAIRTYPREGIVHWLRVTARRRAKGELSKPGGWFFGMLKKNVAPLASEPNGHSTYQDHENDQYSDDMEV